MTKVTPPPVSGSEFAEGKKYARRWMPQDVELPGERRLSERENGTDADKDYFGNFKKFARKDDMSAEPNREKGCEPGHEKSRSKAKE